MGKGVPNRKGRGRSIQKEGDVIKIAKVAHKDNCQTKVHPEQRCTEGQQQEEAEIQKQSSSAHSSGLNPGVAKGRDMCNLSTAVTTRASPICFFRET